MAAAPALGGGDGRATSVIRGLTLVAPLGDSATTVENCRSRAATLGFRPLGSPTRERRGDSLRRLLMSITPRSSICLMKIQKLQQANLIINLLPTGNKHLFKQHLLLQLDQTRPLHPYYYVYRSHCSIMPLQKLIPNRIINETLITGSTD